MEGSTLPWESLDPDHYFGLNRLSCHLVGCCFCRLHLAIFHFRLLSVENRLWDEVIYLFLLLATIGLGEVLRRFDNANIKQSISTAIGFAIVFIVSGFHTLHCVLTAAVNALIIRYVSPK
jgi:hypothetical protein